MKNELSRSWRAIGLIIAGSVADISILITAVTAAVALSQSIHTAQFVNQLAHNISQALKTQEDIDLKIESQLATLESTMLAIGNEVESFQWQLWLRCHAAFKSIHVTNAPYNNSQWKWHKTHSHLLRVQHYMNLSLDLHNLHHKILDIQNAQLDMIDS